MDSNLWSYLCISKCKNPQKLQSQNYFWNFSKFTCTSPVKRGSIINKVNTVVHDSSSICFIIHRAKHFLCWDSRFYIYLSDWHHGVSDSAVFLTPLCQARDTVPLTILLQSLYRYRTVQQPDFPAQHGHQFF